MLQPRRSVHRDGAAPHCATSNHVRSDNAQLYCSVGLEA